jgi:hypothetical protein
MNAQVSRRESTVGALILLIMLIFLVWVYQRQERFDPSVLVMTALREVPPEGPAPAVPVESPFKSWIPKELSPFGPPERFDSETLSEKINGKAELYLSSGFASLQCQRFSVTRAEGAWVEVFLYDMGDPRNAFSVFSSQRRAEAEDVHLTRFAYRTSNALFLAHGQEYLEIIGSDETLGEETLAIGRRFVESRPLDGGGLDELGLFPRDGLDAASITLLSANVFGYELLDNTYIAAYVIGASKITAFVSRRGTDGDAERLASAYVRFLLDNGAAELNSPLKIPGVKVVQLFDTIEVVFSKGRLLAGVHEAEDQAAAEALAMRLYEALLR